MQGSNGETDIENRHMGLGRGEERVSSVERVTWKLTLPYVKQIASGNLRYGLGNSNRALHQSRGVGDRTEVQKGGDICILMADSC